jgi:hypothetical protein
LNRTRTQQHTNTATEQNRTEQNRTAAFALNTALNTAQQCTELNRRLKQNENQNLPKHPEHSVPLVAITCVLVACTSMAE